MMSSRGAGGEGRRPCVWAVNGEARARGRRANSNGRPPSIDSLAAFDGWARREIPMDGIHKKCTLNYSN